VDADGAGDIELDDDERHITIDSIEISM